MLLLLLSLMVGAQEPHMTIIVKDNQFEEIYMEDPKVICSNPCSFQQDASVVFIEANRHHRAWFKAGEISAIYNSETVKYTFGDCDFKNNPFQCAHDNGIWVLRTTITQDDNRASIHVMLFDENAIIIGQGTYTRAKRTTVIERKKITNQQIPSPNNRMTVCPDGLKACVAFPDQSQDKAISQTEDLVPTVIIIPPMILAKDVGQVMIYMYDSVRKY
jgi:hypothetical protein